MDEMLGAPPVAVRDVRLGRQLRRVLRNALVALGLSAGYLGGAWDNAVNRVMDVLFSIPGLLLAVGVAAMRGPGVNSAVFAIAIVYTPIFARVMRGPVLAEREKEYVEAVRAL